MPPLESKKLLFQKAIKENSRSRAAGGNGVKLMFIDVKKAHLNGFLADDDHTFIQLPNEVKHEGRRGRLRKWLYGMRLAASAWEKDYSARLAALGFKKGAVAPTVIFCEEKNIRCVMHGDDFTFMGEKGNLMFVAKSMQEVYELKIRAVLGDEHDDDKEIAILNRMLTWMPGYLEYEADEKQVREILKYFDLDSTSKSLGAPSVKESSSEVTEHSEPLDAQGKTEFRGLAARANYLSLDCMDIQLTTKEICRDMASPTQ
jgi:hypothetical protein